MPQKSLEAASSSDYQFIFDSALNAYKKKTGKDLTKDPLLGSFETCQSPDAVLTILRAQIRRPGNRDDKLTTWLDPTVNVISAFSATVGSGVGLVSVVKKRADQLPICVLIFILEAYPPARVIFTSIGILLSVSIYVDPIPGLL